MEALIGSSSSSCSPYLPLVNNTCHLPLLPLHHNINHTTLGGFNLSISVSSSPIRLLPVPLSSSSHAQAQVHDHQLLIQEPPNGGYTVEAETQTVGVQVQLQRECSFGQNFLITGDHPILGLWDPNNAVPLTWSDGHIWTANLDIPVGVCINFKLIMQESNGKFVWQPGPDRVLQCFQTQKIITICQDWENPDSRMIIETDPTMNQEIQFVETSTVIQEPAEYAMDIKEALVSDEVVPVLVPGLSQLPVHEGPDDEPALMTGADMVCTDSTAPDMAKVVVSSLSQLPVNEVPDDELVPMNGAAMASAGPDMAEDLTLPELDSKVDIANTSNSNPRHEISSIQENQESCENKHQEMQVAEEQDHQATQPMVSLLHNDIQWSNNIMQKILNIFGIQ